MFTLRRTLKFFTINFMVLAWFVAAGGHLHVLWQPFELMITVSIILVMHGFSKSKFKNPKSLEEAKEKSSIGLASMVLSCIATFSLGTIFTMDYLDQGRQIVGALMASNLVVFYFCPMIYYCYYFRIESDIVYEGDENIQIKGAA